MKYLLLILLTILSFHGAIAQSLSIFKVDTTNFPTMTAKFYAFDAVGRQVRPSASELTLTENGIARTITSVNCPVPPPPKAISSVLVMDVSGSMSDGQGSTANIDLAKKAAQAWVNALPLGASEAALTSFDNNNYLNQDFTTDRNKLITAINTLTPNTGTDYDAAMIKPMAGGLLVSQSGKYQKIIVFLSDGLPNSEPNTAQIITEAKRQNCIIFCVTLGIPAPQCMKDMASQTGGLCFEKVTNVTDAEDVYRKILQVAIGGTPCELVWQSGISCQIGLTNVICTHRPFNITSSTSYQSPITSIAELTFAPSVVRFNNAPPKIPASVKVTVTATNSDFTVSNITSSNPAFSISPTSFTLTKGQSITLSVTFTPLDSGFSFGYFTAISKLCPSTLSAVGGFIGKKPSVPTLKLTRPNGGENYVVGSDSVITWEGIPATDSVTLGYSIDNGNTWKTLTTTANGLRYVWKNIPKPPSNQCKVRIKQATNADGTSGKPGTLQYTLSGHTNRVNHVSWSPDGSKVATASDDGTSIIWSTVTGVQLFKLIGHTDQVIHISWSPDGSKIATASFDKTSIIWSAVSGAKLFTLSGHNDGVLHVSWSPDGSKVATSSFDKTSIIWSTLTGAKLLTLNGHTSWVNQVSWSPDGSKVATAGTDRTSIVWNTITGAKLFVFKGHTESIYHVSWSPDGSKVATASADETAIIWSAVTGAKLLTLSGHTSYLYYISWSPDGSKVATASTDNTSIIWSIVTGAKLFTLIGHTQSVNTVNWSPDGSKVATASDDRTSIIWSAVTGAQLLTLSGHTRLVNYVSWSPDGSTLATTSLDNTAKIWNIEEISLQADESNSVFNVVAPMPASQNVDMKQCLIGSVKDSVVQQFIANRGTYPFKVDSIEIVGADASQFSVVSGTPPITIDAASHAVEFRFRPASIGIKTAQLLIFTQADTLIQIITGEGVAPAVSIVNQFIDFGKVSVNYSKDTLQAVTIKNIGTAPLAITATQHAGPNDIDFSTLSGGGKFILLPDSSALLNLRFSPKDAGRTSGRILFEYNGVGSPATVQLYGEGFYVPSITSTASVSFDSVCINAPKTIDVTIKNDGNQPMQLLRVEWITNVGNAFTTTLVPQTLAVDSSITLPIEFTPKTEGAISAEVRWVADKDTTFSTISGIGKICSTVRTDTAHTTIVVQDIIAQAGENVLLTLKLKKQSGMQLTGAPTDWQARIHYNNSILFNQQTNNACMSGLNDSCVVEISGIYNPQSDELISIPCVVTLGNIDNSIIVIDTFYWKNNSIFTETQTQNGNITITGICEQGGVRLFIPAKNSTSLTARPNPAENALQIQYGLREPLLVSLELLNITGQVMQTMVNNQLQLAGQYVFTQDLSQVGNGVYVLRLKTNKETLSTRVDVVK